jgi:acyl dehydratase
MNLLSTELIGRELRPFTYTTEPAKIRYFLRGLGVTESVFVDSDIARARGFGGLPAPPGLILFVSAQDSYAEVFDAIGMDYVTDLSAELDLEFHRPVLTGDILHGRTKVIDIVTKAGNVGTLQFVKLETRYFDDQERLTLTELSAVAHVAATGDHK